jgi:uncharacterized protein involved in response to NO
MFGLLAAGSVVRVLLPLLDTTHFVFWIALSQLLWLLAYALFLWVFLPMLWRPRTDGQFG